jgi:transposase
MNNFAKENIIYEEPVEEKEKGSHVLKATISKQLGIKTSKKRSQERMNILGDADINILRDIQALTAYIEGGTVEEISEQFDVDVNTFKSRMKKLNIHGVRSIFDLRENNGQNQEKIITKAVAQRIIELKIKEPQIGTRTISSILKKQDGTRVSHVTIDDFLKKVQLNDYEPSEFVTRSFSP